MMIVMKNWPPDRFKRPIFVDEVSMPTESINSSAIGLSLNGMDIDDTSAS